MINKIYKIVQQKASTYQRVYRTVFYIICLSIIASSFLKFGGAMNRIKLGFGDLKFRLDHVLHATAYLIFSLYYLFGQFFGFKVFKDRSLIFFFLIVFGVGLFAEGLQYWVPYRSFSLLDLLSNLVGVGLGYVVTVVGLRWKAVGSRQ